MAWTFDFIRMIGASTIRPIYLIESLGLTGDRDRLGGIMKLSSAILPGYRAVLSPEGSRVSYGSLRVGEWSYTQAEWDIGLVNQNDGSRDIRHTTARGQIVALKIGFPGWTTGQYQTVALGVVQDIAMQDGRWTIKLRSILSALTTRSTVTTAEQPLFYLLAETTLDTAYTVGGNPELVGGNGSFHKEASPGTNRFAIRITPDPPSAGVDPEPFVLTATAKAAGPPVVLTRDAVILGTDADAAAGNRVEILAYVKDHPLEVIRKVLCSTGTVGANGTFDTLPESWGLGIDQSLIDDGDCRDHVTMVDPGVATPVWDVYAAAEAEDALAWIASVLAPIGGFVCERQGLITIRAASTHFQRPFNVRTWEVDDNDLVSIDSYNAYDPSQPVEYSRVRVAGPRGTTTDSDETVSTMPALGIKRIDLPFTESDRIAWRNYVIDAVAPYFLRIGQPVTVTLRGWRMAQATPGDHIRIHTSTDYLSGRRRGRGNDLSTGAAMLITSVEPDWFGATCRITGVYLTDEPDEV